MRALSKKKISEVINQHTLPQICRNRWNTFPSSKIRAFLEILILFCLILLLSLGYLLMNGVLKLQIYGKSNRGIICICLLPGSKQIKNMG